jgi:flagellum-specific peptidoglycan hydrolase FlgJ
MKNSLIIILLILSMIILFYRGKVVEEQLNREQINMMAGFGLETAKEVSRIHDYKIPASIIMAQAILESGWGNSKSARKFNAFFGWKASRDWNGKTGTNNDGVCRAYDSATDSYINHAQSLRKYDRYSKCFDIIASTKKQRFDKWAICLQNAGYCEDRKQYAKKLIRIGNRYKLYEHD